MITAQLGKEKFQNYVNLFDYGNKDVSGAPGKNDGLLNGWLGTSLKISPAEQVQFLEKLISNSLGVSIDAQEKTKEIMDRKEEWNGWKLYGKTGGGLKNDGWFVGWIEKKGQHIIFAYYLDLDDPNIDLADIDPNLSIGMIAKELIEKKILNFLE